MSTHIRRLTKPQRFALELLERSPYEGVVTSSSSDMLDNQPWINWRTAYALHKRGLVAIEPYGEEDSQIKLNGKVYD